jgi:hypothetical protein
MRRHDDLLSPAVLSPAILYRAVLHLALLHHALGLACVFAGAWLSQLSGSLLPLALGSSVASMTTFALVRVLLARARARRAAR